MPTPGTVMVLGVGNVLLTDDGVGSVVAQSLIDDPLPFPEGTRILDGGTLGLELITELDDVALLVFVDAVDHRAEPGAISVWSGKEVSRVFSRPLSVHQVGVGELLGTLQLAGRFPPEVWVVGVQPADLEPAVGLSPPVEAAVPALRQKVLEVVRDAWEQLGGQSPAEA